LVNGLGHGLGRTQTQTEAMTRTKTGFSKKVNMLLTYIRMKKVNINPVIELWKKLKKNFGALATLLAMVIIFSSCALNKPFTLVLLPDTQKYSMRHPEIFSAQTKWIAENADNITFVLHQGDITDNNNDEEWRNAVNALFLMDNKVPYTFVSGNHDLGSGGSANTRDSRMLNQYLPYEKYSRMKGFGGAFETGSMDNTWHTFKAGGLDWLILSLEFGPRDKVLNWANDVVKAHARHKVIVNTHAYMYSDNTRINAKKDHQWVPQRYGIGKATGDEATNDGEMIWEKLISQHSNILLVFSGHVLNSGVGKLVSEGIHGNKVYQMLANYQDRVTGSVNGGNGFLRIITIDTKKNMISVKTYSPHINEYKTDPDQQFIFEDVRF
jgi:hypothetical protein